MYCLNGVSTAAGQDQLDMMAVKAGAQPLDYSLWNEHKDYYFKAIQAGLEGDYRFVERLVRDVLSAQ